MLDLRTTTASWLAIGALLLGCQGGGTLVGDDDTGPADDDDTGPADDDDTGPADDDDDTTPEDADGDGYSVDEDCDDNDPQMYPGVTICDDLDVLECGEDGQLVAVENCSPGACVDGQCDTLTCDAAAALDSHLGCQFYAYDMKHYTGYDENQLAVVVVNGSADYPATVTVEERSGGAWTEAETVLVEPRSEVILRLPDRAVDGTVILPGAASRIRSDLPLTAVQYNPLAYDTYTADASLLLPGPGLDDEHVIPAQPGGDYGESTLVVVAARDGVEITVTPACHTAAGDEISGGVAGVAMAPVVLDEGDALQLVGSAIGQNLAGTLVESSGPVAVFSGHPCVQVPEDQGYCDHLEEQIPGTRRWGTRAVAARLPSRTNPPERTVWQVVAGPLGTTLTFEAGSDVVGVPGTPVDLSPLEVLELVVSGTEAEPGDFTVEGTEVFLLTQYLVGYTVAGAGDPCMALTTPIDRFRESFWVYADPHMDSNHLTITRETGTTVEVNGTDIDAWPAGVQIAAAGGGYELARIAVNPGLYDLVGTAPFGLVVGGWSTYVSLCYAGGF